MSSEDRGDEAPDLMEALKQSVERAREKRRVREDRVVQVEARTLSGVHIGREVRVTSDTATFDLGRLAAIEHDEEATTLTFTYDGDRNSFTLDPRTLVAVPREVDR